MAVKRSNGKWFTDKDPNLRFDTYDMAKDADMRIVEKPKAPIKKK